MDPIAVNNCQFREFVEATDHVTFEATISSRGRKSGYGKIQPGKQPRDVLLSSASLLAMSAVSAALAQPAPSAAAAPPQQAANASGKPNILIVFGASLHEVSRSF
jgi:hypothetical protein